MKKGDLVVIKDGSWSRKVEDNKLKFGPGGDEREQFCGRELYVIIEIGCSFPNTGSYGGTYNDTVIQSVSSGLVVFIEQRFLVPATHTINIDGKIVELSHESFLNLKEQLI